MKTNQTIARHKMKALNTLLKMLIGVAILFTLLYKVGFGNVYANLLRLNLFYIPLVVIVLFFINLIGAFKLSFFLPPFGIKLHFLKVYHYYFLTSCFGMFIPGRIGELSLVYFFKREKVALGMGTAITILDKIISMGATLTIAVAAIFLFFDFGTSIKIVLMALIPFIGAVYFIFSNFGRMLLKRFILRKFESKFHGFSKALFCLLRDNPSAVLMNVLLSFIKWLANALFLFILFYAIGQNVGFLHIALINSIMVLVSFVPISVSGLGIKESAGVFLFSLIGVPAAVSSSALILSLVINYLVAFLYVILLFDMNKFGAELKSIFD